MHQITASLLDRWMATWKAKTYWSKSKRRDNCIAFFEHCIDKKWIPYNATAKDKGNPARGMMRFTTAKGSTIPTLPFTPAQFNAVLAVTLRYEEGVATVNKKEVENKGIRLHALVNLMRWSGLSITDAVTLGRDRLGADNRLELHRTKTGNPALAPRSRGRAAPMSRRDGMRTQTTSFGAARARRTKPLRHGRRHFENCGSW